MIQQQKRFSSYELTLRSDDYLSTKEGLILYYYEFFKD